MVQMTFAVTSEHAKQENCRRCGGFFSHKPPDGFRPLRRAGKVSCTAMCICLLRISGWGFVLFMLSALLSSVACVNGVVLRSEFGVERREPRARFPILLLFKAKPAGVGAGIPSRARPRVCARVFLCVPQFPSRTARLSVPISFVKGTEMIINYENNSTRPHVADRRYGNCRALVHGLLEAAPRLFA